MKALSIQNLFKHQCRYFYLAECSFIQICHPQCAIIAGCVNLTVVVLGTDDMIHGTTVGLECAHSHFTTGLDKK